MPKRINYGGKTHVFPDDFTDEDISAALAEESGPQSPEAPKQDPADIFRGQLGRMGSFGAAPTQEDIQAGREANVPLLTLGAMAAPAAIPTSLAGLKALALGTAGASAGGYAGKGIGQGLEYAGAPEGTAEVGGAVGGLVGGVAGPMGGPQVLTKLLKIGGGKGGLLAEVGERALGRGVAQATPEAAAAAARKLELDIAAKEAAIATKQAQAQAIAAREARAAEAHAARMEILKQKAAGKPGPKLVPSTPKAAPPQTSGANALQPEVIPDEAVSLVAEPLPFVRKGQTKMPTVYTKGPAKPGPAPTPPEKLEETLRASIEAAKAKKPSPATVEKALTEAAQELNDEGLRVPRIAVGAQRVGRQVGMTKEAVRQASGPILNETRGEASPIFPRQALESIVDKIRTIPMAEREAYVRAATSEKAMWQVETIRRTLEKLGLLLPVGVAAGAVAGE